METPEGFSLTELTMPKLSTVSILLSSDFAQKLPTTEFYFASLERVG